MKSQKEIVGLAAKNLRSKEILVKEIEQMNEKALRVALLLARLGDESALEDLCSVSLIAIQKGKNLLRVLKEN